MVAIPAGSFTMGNDAGGDDEKPAHPVDLPAFQIDRFEVTNAEFARFVQATGYQTDSERAGENKTWRTYAEGRDNHPVVKVSWNDAAAYCQLAGKRLPTEAEWEKAARGTDSRLYPWGNDWDPARLNGRDGGRRDTAPVGSFPAGAGPYGTLDMAGNVWEWTADWYKAYPGNTRPSQYYGEKFKVLRGGGWFDTQAQVTTTNRSSNIVTAANDDIGFRCAK
jgi:formylglycine-generating enzyme required for sulfatase activity